MTTRRYNVVTPRARKNSDKPYWHPVGTAFEDDRGITLYLDSSPYPDTEGRVVLKLFEPREREDRPQRGRGDWSGGVKDHFPDAEDAPF